MKKLFPQLIASLLIIGVLVPSLNFVFIKPKPAQAFSLGPFSFEINPTVLAEFKDVIKEISLDAIIKKVGLTVLRNLTNSIVKWIENGGTPSFISDFTSLFDGVEDIVTDALNTALGGQLCSSFNLTIVAAARKRAQEPPTLQDRLRCTFDQAVNNLTNPNVNLINPNDQRDPNLWYLSFAAGGFEAYTEANKCQNDPLCAYSLMLEVGGDSASEQVAANVVEAIAGGGFRGIRDSVTGLIHTPGRFVAQILDKSTVSNFVDQVVASDEIGELITSIAFALVTKITTTGLFKVKDTSKPQTRGIDARNKALETLEKWVTQKFSLLDLYKDFAQMLYDPSLDITSPDAFKNSFLTYCRQCITSGTGFWNFPICSEVPKNPDGSCPAGSTLETRNTCSGFLCVGGPTPYLRKISGTYQKAVVSKQCLDKWMSQVPGGVNAFVHPGKLLFDRLYAITKANESLEEYRDFSERQRYITGSVQSTKVDSCPSSLPTGATCQCVTTWSSGLLGSLVKDSCFIRTPDPVYAILLDIPGISQNVFPGELDALKALKEAVEATTSEQALDKIYDLMDRFQKNASQDESYLKQSANARTDIRKRNDYVGLMLGVTCYEDGGYGDVRTSEGEIVPRGAGHQHETDIWEIVNTPDY